MKLGGQKIPAGQRSGKRVGVFSRRQGELVAGKCVTVHKIKIAAVLDTVKQRVRLRLSNAAPTCIGDGRVGTWLQPDGFFRDNVEAQCPVLIR